MEEHVIRWRRLDRADSRRRADLDEDEAARASRSLKPAGDADGVALIDAQPAPRKLTGQGRRCACDALEHGVGRVLINKPLRRPADSLTVNKQDVAVPEGQPHKTLRGDGSRLDRTGRQMNAVDERVHAGVPQ